MTKTLNTSSSIGSFVDLITISIVFIFILLLAFFFTRWLGKTQANLGKNKNIQVLEIYRISQTKLIEIVKIGNKYIAVGVSKDNMEFLCELDKDDIVFPAETMNTSSFQDIFYKLKNNAEKEK